MRSPPRYLDAGRYTVSMTQMTVELDDAAARRLAKRARREGIELSALAGRLLNEMSEVDPFEFVGSYESDLVAAKDTDDFLRDSGFGAS